MKIGKKGYKGKPYHGGGFYEFLDVDIDRNQTDYDATLIAECLSHGDILDCFVCRFVADPILVPLSLEYGKSGVGEEASQNSGPNASFDVELEPIHEAQENAIHEAQENASNPAPVPANSNTSSHVHSFTAPNTPPPTHQTPTHIHHSTDPTFDLVHPSSDPILDHEQKKGSDAGYDESTGGNRNNLEGKLAGDEPYYPSDEAASFETDPNAFSDDEEEVQQRERVKPRRKKKTYNPVHKCDPTNRNKLCNSKFLSSHNSERIKE
ncbi:hypothetical protein KY290_023046 [Solanum tuberosum]|uniref:Uncharacterized protein n=1 Tax=Solanum tuberosum TaxID=4113 RepID=A0ABQ7V768_SOLTU|nr:hypothetical protein KY284_021936 [Solanum tuberosum]KAH0684329.1 hypothetical protein KY289_022081 [Solanum tuberosum]KAH0694729.1 hypothetical protein KY285_021826 [Solanum tuberosum]KAH0759553.1 hypothetical protein KY290_023046 [Solanum tuberosum]